MVGKRVVIKKVGPLGLTFVFSRTLSNSLHDFCSCLWFVHGIDVYIRYTVLLQIENLIDSILDAGFSHVFRMVTIGGNDVRHFLGNR